MPAISPVARTSLIRFCLGKHPSIWSHLLAIFWRGSFSSTNFSLSAEGSLTLPSDFEKEQEGLEDTGSDKYSARVVPRLFSAATTEDWGDDFWNPVGFPDEGETC